MRKFCKKESGAIILEGALCIFATMFILVLIYAMGFLIYQRAMMSIVANQVAEEIAVTCKFPNAMDASSITREDVVGLGLFRYSPFGDYGVFAGEFKATKLASDRLALTSLAIDKGGFDVQVVHFPDDMGRGHYEVTVQNKYATLWGDIWGYTGSSPFIVKSYAVETDMVSYTDTISTTKSLVTIATRNEKVLKAINKFVGAIDKLVDAIINRVDG